MRKEKPRYTAKEFKLVEDPVGTLNLIKPNNRVVLSGTPGFFAELGKMMVQETDPGKKAEARKLALQEKIDDLKSELDSLD